MIAAWYSKYLVQASKVLCLYNEKNNKIRSINFLSAQ